MEWKDILNRTVFIQFVKKPKQNQIVKWKYTCKKVLGLHYENHESPGDSNRKEVYFFKIHIKYP